VFSLDQSAENTHARARKTKRTTFLLGAEEEEEEEEEKRARLSLSLSSLALSLCFISLRQSASR